MFCFVPEDYASSDESHSQSLQAAEKSHLTVAKILKERCESQIILDLHVVMQTHGLHEHSMAAVSLVEHSMVAHGLLEHCLESTVFSNTAWCPGSSRTQQGCPRPPRTQHGCPRSSEHGLGALSHLEHSMVALGLLEHSKVAHGLLEHGMEAHGLLEHIMVALGLLGYSKVALGHLLTHTAMATKQNTANGGTKTKEGNDRNLKPKWLEPKWLGDY